MRLQNVCEPQTQGNPYPFTGSSQTSLGAHKRLEVDWETRERKVKVWKVEGSYHHRKDTKSYTQSTQIPTHSLPKRIKTLCSWGKNKASHLRAQMKAHRSWEKRKRKKLLFLGVRQET